MATFLNDTFTDTNAVVLGSHTGETGATWTQVTGQTGVFTINTNRAYVSSGVAYYYASGTPASADYEVSATIRIASTGLNCQEGVVGRIGTGAATGYRAYMDRISSGAAIRCILASVAAGTPTVLGNTGDLAPTAGSDHIIKLRMVGDQISMYYDGALTLGPFTNTAVTTAGKAGVTGNAVTTTTGFHIADIAAADVGGAPTPTRAAYNYPDLAVHRASIY